jgi:pimeloyl-ACP methyl ester carboxylesterase
MPRLEQRIHISEIEGHRIAFAEVGSGPPLVVPAPWVSNLHVEWDDGEYRSWIERLATEHTVIRYDRPGTGLSDRELPARMSLDFDVAVLEGLLDELGAGPVSLLGVSCGGCIALGYRDGVRRLLPGWIPTRPRPGPRLARLGDPRELGHGGADAR